MDNEKKLDIDNNYCTHVEENENKKRKKTWKNGDVIF